MDWLTAIRQAGHLCFPPPLPAATADPDDEMFVECAVAAKADYLVTGDKGHLLVLKHAGGIPVVAAAEFLQILGGESGPGARPMEASWVRFIRAQCRRHSVAFFFKQWGGVNKKESGRELDGQTWDQMPSLPEDTNGY